MHPHPHKKANTVKHAQLHKNTNRTFSQKLSMVYRSAPNHLQRTPKDPEMPQKGPRKDLERTSTGPRALIPPKGPRKDFVEAELKKLRCELVLLLQRRQLQLQLKLDELQLASLVEARDKLTEAVFNLARSLHVAYLPGQVIGPQCC